MAHKSFLGWLSVFLAFPLLLLTRKREKTNGVPTVLRDAVEKAFTAAGYQSLIEYWLAVSKMETGGFTSHLYTMSNNPWGMKQPRQRPTKSIGSYPGWAKYATYTDAAKDIVLWMEYNRFPKSFGSLEGFIRGMKDKAYFEEPYDHYLKLVKAWSQR